MIGSGEMIKGRPSAGVERRIGDEHFRMTHGTLDVSGQAKDDD